MLFPLGRRVVRTPVPGTAGTAARAAFAIAMTLLAAFVLVTFTLLFIATRVDDGDIYRTDGDTPIRIHGGSYWRPVSCGVGDQPSFRAPKQRNPGEWTLEKPGHRIPPDGVPKELVCNGPAMIAEGRVVRLAWLVERIEVPMAAIVLGALGRTFGWSTIAPQWRLPSPGLSGSSPRRATSRRP